MTRLFLNSFVRIAFFIALSLVAVSAQTLNLDVKANSTTAVRTCVPGGISNVRFNRFTSVWKLGQVGPNGIKVKNMTLCRGGKISTDSSIHKIKPGAFYLEIQEGGETHLLFVKGSTASGEEWDRTVNAAWYHGPRGGESWKSIPTGCLNDAVLVGDTPVPDTLATETQRTETIVQTDRYKQTDTRTVVIEEECAKVRGGFRHKSPSRPDDWNTIFYIAQGGGRGYVNNPDHRWIGALADGAEAWFNSRQIKKQNPIANGVLVKVSDPFTGATLSTANVKLSEARAGVSGNDIHIRPAVEDEEKGYVITYGNTAVGSMAQARATGACSVFLSESKGGMPFLLNGLGDIILHRTRRTTTGTPVKSSCQGAGTCTGTNPVTGQPVIITNPVYPTPGTGRL